MSSANSPSSPTKEELEQRFAAKEPEAAALAQGVTTAIRTQADADRSWIARTIIWILVGAVFGVLVLLLVRGLMTGEWDVVTTQAVDVLKSTVLPIVTLVLGYYFGQSSKTN